MTLNIQQNKLGKKLGKCGFTDHLLIAIMMIHFRNTSLSFTFFFAFHLLYLLLIIYTSPIVFSWLGLYSVLVYMYNILELWENGKSIKPAFCKSLWRIR